MPIMRDDSRLRRLGSPRPRSSSARSWFRYPTSVAGDEEEKERGRRREHISRHSKLSLPLIRGLAPCRLMACIIVLYFLTATQRGEQREGDADGEILSISVRDNRYRYRIRSGYVKTFFRHRRVWSMIDRPGWLMDWSKRDGEKWTIYSYFWQFDGIVNSFSEIFVNCYGITVDYLSSSLD